MKLNRLMFIYTLVAMIVASVSLAANNPASHTTSQFQGPKANTGTAMYFKENGKGC